MVTAESDQFASGSSNVGGDGDLCQMNAGGAQMGNQQGNCRVSGPV